MSQERDAMQNSDFYKTNFNNSMSIGQEGASPGIDVRGKGYRLSSNTRDLANNVIDEYDDEYTQVDSPEKSRIKAIRMDDEKSEQTQKPNIFLSKNASISEPNFQIVKDVYNDEADLDEQGRVRFNSILKGRSGAGFSQQELEMTVVMLQRENQKLKKGLMKVLHEGDQSKLKELLENDLFQSIQGESSPSIKAYIYDIDEA